MGAPAVPDRRPVYPVGPLASPAADRGPGSASPEDAMNLPDSPLGEGMPSTLQRTPHLCHNGDMRRKRHSSLLWLLPLCALLAAAFTPRADAVWQCEGRTCATTPWFCCCVLPASAQDPNCQRPSRVLGVEATASATCATACRCVLTARPTPDASLHAASDYRASVSCFVACMRGEVNPTPPRSNEVARITPRRGPPPSSVTLDTPSLRAPPLS